MLQDTPKLLTRKFLLKRGWCCNLGCLNCPYDMTTTKTTQRTEMSIDDFNKIILHDGGQIDKYLDGKNPKIEYIIKPIRDTAGGALADKRVTTIILTVEK